ncbi:helix-turn-helix domain-containing protein [Bernardetia sp.]|uniref:helix-turn-helix domain-containing protein n=1 Tax=Bernardetia sp. TaxID=1937974 RepID=UPI0025C5CCCD|nr:helix-turn-helix transcriptional regulator [Bernardetia sp.]
MKKIIEQSDYGQSEIAGLLKISVPTLRRIYGRDSVDLDILLRFCKIFDLKPSYFAKELDGLDTSITKEVSDEKEISWKEKYFQSQKEVLSLKSELKEVRDRLDKITEALAQKFLGVDFSNSNLGKAKASSYYNVATLSEEREIKLSEALTFLSQL